MSSNSRPSPQSPAVLKAVSFILENPGTRTVDVAHHMACCVNHASKCLTVAKLGGLLAIVRDSSSSRWYPVEMVEAVRARQKVERRKRERESQARRNLRQRERMAGLAADAEGSAELEDQPIRRRVDARAPLPFQLRAPASVFHLGAML